MKKLFSTILVLGTALLIHSSIAAETEIAPQKQKELIATYFLIAVTAFEHKQISYGCENLLEINKFSVASKSDLQKVKKYSKKHKCKNAKIATNTSNETKNKTTETTAKTNNVTILNTGGKKLFIVKRIDNKNTKECVPKESKFKWQRKECISLTDLAEVGVYKPIDNFPEGMIKEFGKGCKKEICRLKKASAKMYNIFVQRGEMYHVRHPGEMIKGMAWYELVYFAKLKKTQKAINKYKKYGPQKKTLFSNNEAKIIALIKMNKGRKNMRKAMGMSINDDIETVIKKHWTLGEFLNNDKLKAKKVTMDPDIKKRKLLLEKYQTALKKYKAKLEEEKKKL